MKRALSRSIGVSLLIAFIPIALVPARGQETKGKITSALQPYVDSKSLAGAVTLVATKDRVLTLESIGFADIAGMIAMPIDAIFWIASMTKPITGAALMMLVDEGKLTLDDPIEKFLPEFKGQWVIVEQDKDRMVLGKTKRPITVRDVMNHTSGMPFASIMEKPTIDVLPLKDAVRSYALTPLNSEPGSKYVYSNAGINTGGRIIEVVSGMPYDKFLDQRLFGPLGTKDTTFWPSEAQLKRLAKTYKPGKNKTGLEEMPPRCAIR
jgi:CubicO group peptidase (beta-lactamase class C family)